MSTPYCSRNQDTLRSINPKLLHNKCSLLPYSTLMTNLSGANRVTQGQGLGRSRVGGSNQHSPGRGTSDQKWYRVTSQQACQLATSNRQIACHCDRNQDSTTSAPQASVSRRQGRISTSTCAAASEETSFQNRTPYDSRLTTANQCHDILPRPTTTTTTSTINNPPPNWPYYPSTPPSSAPGSRQSSSSTTHPRNTANLTSTLLSRTGLTFAEGVKASPPPSRSPVRALALHCRHLQRSPSREMGVAAEENSPPPLVVQSAERKMASFRAAGPGSSRKSRRRTEQ